MCYAYNADIYCDDCAEEIKAELDREGYEDSGDTGDYPQYSNSDESDSPQHCADCGEFMENALTSDGFDYVKDIVADDLESGRDDSIACTVWAPYYGISWECEWCDNPVKPGETECSECSEDSE